MKFKLDENIGHRGAELFRAAGHDVSSVREQNLNGAPDETVFEIASREGRALITLDRGFGEVLRFPPERSPGIVIVEVGPSASLAALLSRLRELLGFLQTQSPAGKLWIVEPGRLRIHLRNGED